MRIVVAQAKSALQREISQLSTKCQQCQRQIGKFSTLGFGGVSGKGVSAAETRMRMQASIATAHLNLFQSLAAADRQNLQLVSSLPTTSPGVLDTSVAQERIDRARQSIADLRMQMSASLERARAANELAASCDFGDEPVSYIDLCGIESMYHSLIAAQQQIADHNERILVRARQYERSAASAYAAVNTSFVDGAKASSLAYVRTRAWGDTAWVGGLSLHIAKSVIDDNERRAQSPSLLNRFLAGDLSVEKTVTSGGMSQVGEVLGMATTLGAKGTLFGAKASLGPYGKSGLKDDDEGKGQKSATVGVEGGLEASVANGEVSYDVGLWNTVLKGTFLGCSATGTLGASLFSNGTYSPSAEAKLEGEASALTGEVATTLGTKDFALNSKAKGDLASASGKVGAQVGANGVEVSLGSEAYVAQGELSTGVTLFGVKVSLAKEFKAVGKGAAAEAGISSTGVEGYLGAGLGLGAGVRVKVDWSGLGASLERTGSTLGSWQDLLGTSGRPQVA